MVDVLALVLHHDEQVVLMAVEPGPMSNAMTDCVA